MSRRLLLCAALAATVSLAGCTADTPEPAAPAAAVRRPRPAAGRLRLLRRSSPTTCGPPPRRAVGPWGFPGDGMRAGGRRRRCRHAPDASRSRRPPPARPPRPAFSGTNVHEQGVDEPDIVKTDGRRIVTVDRRHPAGRRRRPPGARPARLDLGAEAGGEADLLLAGDQALVLVTGGCDPAMRADKRASPAADGPRCCWSTWPASPAVISRYRGRRHSWSTPGRPAASPGSCCARTPRIAFPISRTRPTRSKRIAANRKAIDKADGRRLAARLDGHRPARPPSAGTVGCGQVSRPADVLRGRDAHGAHLRPERAGSSATATRSRWSPTATPSTAPATSLYVANDQRWRLELLAAAGDQRGQAGDRDLPLRHQPAPAKPVYAAAGRCPAG